SRQGHPGRPALGRVRAGGRDRPRLLAADQRRHAVCRPALRLQVQQRAPHTAAMTAFIVSVSAFTKPFRTNELPLSEGWATANDALCCPTSEKLSFYRYVKARDRFIRYHTELKRNRT